LYWSFDISLTVLLAKSHNGDATEFVKVMQKILLV